MTSVHRSPLKPPGDVLSRPVEKESQESALSLFKIILCGCILGCRGSAECVHLANGFTHS